MACLEQRPHGDRKWFSFEQSEILKEKDGSSQYSNNSKWIFHSMMTDGYMVKICIWEQSRKTPIHLGSQSWQYSFESKNGWYFNGFQLKYQNFFFKRKLNGNFTFIFLDLIFSEIGFEEITRRICQLRVQMTD